MSGSKSDDGPRPQADFLTWEEVKDLGLEEAPESMGPADDEEASDE